MGIRNETHEGWQAWQARSVWHVHAVEGRLAAGQVALGVQGDVDASTQQQTNANMLGPEVLDVARHPTARLDIQSSLPTARPPGKSPAYDLVGTFTLHGVARPLTLVAEAEDGPAAVRLRGG